MRGVLTILLLLSAACTMAQDSLFSEAERNHIRVATPQLFVGDNELLICSMDLEADGFVFPLPGGKVISPYGKRGGRNHSGTDIKCGPRDTIYCAFDGVVRMARTYSGYGLCIVVRHPSGLETVYSHNTKNLVKSGDQVKAGTPIAIVGRTGRATTEHLHFETRVNGQAFDPAMLFDFDNQKLRNICLRCYKKKDSIVVKEAKKKAKEDKKDDGQEK